MISNRKRVLAFISVIVAVVLAGSVAVQLFISPSDPACSEKPAFESITDWLTRCLSPNASPAEVEALFTQWGYIAPEWGGVSSAHLLPGWDRELVIRYHPDTSITENKYWDPQGKLVVMQWQVRQWQTLFDAPFIINRTTLDGLKAWENWNYHILETGDLTGDGVDDLLVELKWTNGTHTSLRYLNLLTAHPPSSKLHTIFVEDATFTNPTYHRVALENRPALQSVIKVHSQDAITRTLLFDGTKFTQAKETIDPAWCTASTTMLDGSLWCGFDQFDGMGGIPWGEPKLGLYHLHDGQLSHFDIPNAIYALKPGLDGSLYAVATWRVLRYNQGRWETLLDVEHNPPPNFPNNFNPFDLAIAANDDLWVAGIFNLARFNGQTWTPYAIPARRILVAPDQSVWADGWDGNPDGDCCITHLTGSTWITYTHSVSLPVSEDLFSEIRSLHQR